VVQQGAIGNGNWQLVDATSNQIVSSGSAGKTLAHTGHLFKHTGLISLLQKTGTILFEGWGS
jgi:hypothetical protein